MNLQLIDWLIMGGLLAVLCCGALYTRRYANSVSGFLAANRCAGRYLITVAVSIAQLGVITLIWYFQLNYDVGFTSIWWGFLEGPALIVIALSGWVLYRFRQTRALTLAQFFEMRYSRNFRVFSGLVAFVSGLINYGIFPGVAARFFIAVCGFPEELPLAGLEVPAFPLFMTILMGIAIFFVFLGGQIAVMVTDFLQGIFCNLTFLVVIVFLLFTFSWEHISDTLLGRVWEGAAVQPGEEVKELQGKSMIHPFRLGEESRFNVWYWIFSVVVIFYGMKAWQGDQGYNAAARNAHEAKMANILSGWRFRVLMLITLVLPICIRTLMHHPEYAAQAAAVNASLEPLGTEALQAEMRTPHALAVMLPAGLLGLMCAAMLGAFISTNDTYLHSWGAIFIQDVVLPLRGKPLSKRAHLLLLKSAIFGVALFAIAFSWFYEPSQYIAMFLQITGTVFVGGAGAAIIGGLYWKRGTTRAAWTAMIVGMVLSTYGVLIKQKLVGEWLRASCDDWWGPLAEANLWVYENAWVTGMVLSFVAIVAAVSSYVLVSLLGTRREHDLDRLLHRGRYEVAEDRVEARGRHPSWLQKLGFDPAFTGTDRWVTLVTIAWPLVWTLIFIVGTIWNLVVDVSNETWLAWWHAWTWFILCTGAVILVWFTIGGIRNLAEMFHLLRQHRDDEADDGRVEQQGPVRDTL